MDAGVQYAVSRRLKNGKCGGICGDFSVLGWRCFFLWIFMGRGMGMGMGMSVFVVDSVGSGVDEGVWKGIAWSGRVETF